MPYGFYKVFTTADLDAVVAYVKSVTAVSNKVQTPVYKTAQHADIPPGAEKQMTAADLDTPVKRGFYLATIAHCMECHTPMVNGRHDFVNQLGKGGEEFKGPWGVSVSRNITSSKSKGIGDWTDAEIKKAITHGERKDGTKLKPPMGFPLYATMTDGDLNALVAYLRTRAGEGVSGGHDLTLRAYRDRVAPCSFLGAHALAHDVIDVDRREIVGDEIGLGRGRRRLDQALEHLRQRIAEAMPLLQRGRARGQRVPADRRRGRDRDHLAQAGGVEVERREHVGERPHRRGVELGAVVHVEGDRAAGRQPLLRPARRIPWSAGGTAHSRRDRRRPGSGRRSRCGG